MFDSNDLRSFLDGSFMHRRILSRLSAVDSGPIGSNLDVNTISGRALWKFALSRPQKYYDRAAFNAALTILQLAEEKNISTSAEDQRQVERALIRLREMNNTYPDAQLSQNTNDFIILDDLQRNYFPFYATIAESIYQPFLRLLLSIHFTASGIKKNTGPRLRDYHDQAKKYFQKSLSACYSSIVRNAISHGAFSVTANHDIEFRDENTPPLTMPLRNCPQLTDKILDTCNAICAALLLTINAYPKRFKHLNTWATEETLLSLGSNEMFQLDRVREDRLPSGERQLLIFGRHTIWDKWILVENATRAIILCRYLFDKHDRFFLSTTRGQIGSFLVASRNEIPDLQTENAISLLANKILPQSLIWDEAVTLTELIASKLKGSHVINWLREHNASLDTLNAFELREIHNNSAGNQSRWDAVVIAKPTAADLDHDGFPQPKFLFSVFGAIFSRWLLRGGNSRNPGSSYIRFFRSGLVHVYYNDARVRELRNTGLDKNLLFRLEFSLGSPKVRVALGGRSDLFKRIGPFFVSLNPKALEHLKSLALSESEGSKKVGAGRLSDDRRPAGDR